MKSVLTCAVAVIALLTATEAFARGAAANIMNSPGYQRRLQESRGQIPDRSGYMLSTQPSRLDRRSKRRHHQ